MRFVLVSYVQTLVLVAVFALSSGKLRCTGNDSVHGVVTSTATKQRKRGFDGVLENVASVVSRKRKEITPYNVRPRLGSSWLSVRGGARSWGSNKEKENNDEMGQDGADYISKQSAKQDKDSKDGKLATSAHGGDKDGQGSAHQSPNAKTRKKHSLFNNIFRLRFVTSLIRKATL